MSDVAAYHVLFPVQGGMWTGYILKTIIVRKKILSSGNVNLYTCKGKAVP